uniref:Uncharacterized protein n=1 Tax=Aegilops tauschii subsp. strangulata TaxID=200361 RepID=A0A453P9V4_AEGTS
MNLFLGFRREDVPWNFEKTENHVYLHVVLWQKPDADESERLLKKPLCSPLALSVGSDSNGSGAVALLKIARIFSQIYSSLKTRSKFNLLFGLTSG